MNIYAGRPFGWNWLQHLEHGFLGGDDMIATPGEHILAPVAGKVTRTAYTVMITEPDGWRTQALELGSTVSRTSVRVGEQIGVAGTRWVHWHSFTPAGVRVPARFLSDPSAPEEAVKMFKFVKLATEPTIWLTDFLFRRPMTDGADFATTAALLEIPATFITVAPVDWRSVGVDIATLTTPGASPVDADAVDEGELAAALAASGEKILAAIAGVDEATLATFGLKRA